MFRSDRDALASQVDDLREENERLRAENEAMRADLLARRAAEPHLASLYQGGLHLERVGEGERIALSQHRLQAFPVWATAALHVLTFGLSSLVLMNLQHDRLPASQSDDPTAGKAIGCHLIPLFNYYWVFFNGLRLADRLNLQYRLRGLPDRVSRGLVTAACVASVIPYALYVIAPIVWLFVAIQMQRAVNELVERDAEASRVAPPEPTYAPALRVPAVRDLPPPEDVAAQAAAEEEAAGVDDALSRERQ